LGRIVARGTGGVRRGRVYDQKRKTKRGSGQKVFMEAFNKIENTIKGQIPK